MGKWILYTIPYNSIRYGVCILYGVWYMVYDGMVFGIVCVIVWYGAHCRMMCGILWCMV